MYLAINFLNVSVECLCQNSGDLDMLSDTEWKELKSCLDKEPAQRSRDMPHIDFRRV